MTLIRPFQPADIDALTDIYGFHVTHGTASFETSPPSTQEMQGRISELISAQFPVYVGVNTDGQIVGFGYAGPHKTRFGYRYTVEDSIYVHHLHQQKGIGSLILESLISHCIADGYHQMIAVIGDSANHGSIQLHAKAGFRHIGTAHNLGFKFGTFLNVVFMQRQLNASTDFTDRKNKG